jgi:hypothetical protein
MAEAILMPDMGQAYQQNHYHESLDKLHHDQTQMVLRGDAPFFPQGRGIFPEA